MVFCALKSGESVREAKNADTYGYCCVEGSTDPNCTDGDTVECTLPYSQMADPIYMSYWAGMTADKCGYETRKFKATEAVQTIKAPSLLYLNRKPSKVVESCYYLITADQSDLYRTSAELQIALETTSNAKMFVFAGTDRRNFTQVIEQNAD
jgi:hypothetical protein